ncbi:MAG: AMP-binding protein, partial [Roseiarcus sp.]|uniref:AMP-binding protein n=1 Tax=Roseiarcus sp. TaxID=1969460 RepID=UPI003C1C147D
MSANLFDLLLERAPRRDKLAIDAPDGLSLTYSELFARAGRAARALLDCGVEPGDRVAAQIDKSPDCVALALACFKAGAALLPLNPAYTLAELEYFLADAGPALTLCRPKLLVDTRALAKRHALPAVDSFGAEAEGTFFDRLASTRDELPAIFRVKDDMAAILYTSGTTGRSKGAMLTHQNLSSNA